jgi:PII-like signaling protein
MWEWLLKTAAELGVRGGSAFRAVAGFGRHHVLHEQTFFELAGSLAVEVEFIVTDAEARELIELLHQAKLRIFFAQIPAHFDIVNRDAEDPPETASSG